MPRVRYNGGWSRRGFALLWDFPSLQSLCAPGAVRSLRELFVMSQAWPEELPNNGGNTIVVAGLEGCLDAMTADDATQWLERDLRDLILSFQDEYQGQAGLVFWVPSGRRKLSMRGASEEYYWRHRGAGESGLHIGSLLWSGAENEVERIVSDPKDKDYDGSNWVGLTHPRIS